MIHPVFGVIFNNMAKQMKPQTNGSECQKDPSFRSSQRQKEIIQCSPMATSPATPFDYNQPTDQPTNKSK